jgi:hypothetical protein
VAAATHAIERAAAAVELVVGLGIKPADLAPAALQTMAPATAGKGRGSTLDLSAIDTGSLARTVLVARLLAPTQTAFRPLSAAAIKKFKQKFNHGSQLPEIARTKAETILRDAGGGQPLAGARRQTALRWIASLHPLASVLAGGPAAPP